MERTPLESERQQPQVPEGAATVPPTTAEDAELVVEDTLVEDVSIDGMCGVY